MRTLSLKISVMLSFLLVLAGCGSAPPPTPAPEQLLQDYFNSTTVTNDEFTGATNKGDRIANIAAYFTRDDFTSFLLSAYQCANAPSKGSVGGFSGQLGCPPDAAVTQTASAFTGTLYERNIVVKHGNGQLELLPLYVTAAPGGATELIDNTGRAYPGGLDDFRQHNSLLTADDMVLLAASFTTTSGSFRLAVVTGHTPASYLWLYWLIGLVVLVAVLVLIVLLRRRPRASSEQGERLDG